MASAADAAARATVRRFYAAFAEADGDTMASCYAPHAHFSDPVYTALYGDEIGAMWRMLTGRAQDLSIEVRELEADESTGSATWVARYLFGPDRRPVSNHVSSTFFMADGLIQRQKDSFDLHAWTAMALGVKGRLLGWTPVVQGAVRKQALEGLRQFIAAGR